MNKSKSTGFIPKKAPRNLLKKEHLDQMLFKVIFNSNLQYQLKKYYNNLISSREAINNNIEQTNKNIKHYTEEIEDIECTVGADDKNKLVKHSSEASIISPTKKSSTETFITKDNNIENLSLLKEGQKRKEIDEKVEELKKKLRDNKLEYKNESQYTDTINHLIKLEKDGYAITNSKIIEIEEKTAAIELTKKTLTMNMDEKIKKKNNIMQIFKKLKKENERMEALIKIQNSEIDNLDKELENKKDIFDDNFNKSQAMKSDMQKTFYNMKTNTLIEIEENEKIRQLQILKENHYIKIILGLDLMQK